MRQVDPGRYHNASGSGTLCERSKGLMFSTFVLNLWSTSPVQEVAHESAYVWTHFPGG